MPKGELSTEDEPNRRNREQNPAVNKGTNRRNDKTFRRKNDNFVNVDRNEIQRVASECREKGLSRDETGVVLNKWKKREYRRLKRQKLKILKKVCFNCRKPGHQLADCPGVLGTREFAVGVCFKCGSTEHTVAQCRLKIKNFPYAKCFVCGEIGHLSRNCEENPNGAFPDGGSCKECGGLDHLKKDCPSLASTNDNDKRPNGQMGLRTTDHMASADDDSFAYLEEDSVAQLSRKHRPKIVKF